MRFFKTKCGFSLNWVLSNLQNFIFAFFSMGFQHNTDFCSTASRHSIQMNYETNVSRVNQMSVLVLLLNQIFVILLAEVLKLEVKDAWATACACKLVRKVPYFWPYFSWHLDATLTEARKLKVILTYEVSNSKFEVNSDIWLNFLVVLAELLMWP